MSEDFKPVVEQSESIAPISHGRILGIMAVLLITAVTASFIFAELAVTLGLIVGGILAYVNYYWLKAALRNIFENAVADGKKKSIFAGNYLLRYFAIGAVIAFIYYSGIVSIVAVIAGLSAFAAAVVIEGFIRIFLHISKREEF